MGHALLFPPFRLDLRERCLFREGERVMLRPKSFAVLQYLAERTGQILTKQEILAAVWFGVQVDSAALKVCIREIRERLGEDPRAPRYISTIHRHGYRFIGPVQREDSPEPALHVAAPTARPWEDSPAAAAPPAPVLPRPVAVEVPTNFPQPPGVAFSPSWYIPREQEERLALGYLEVPGATALLLGPERFGKTWLMKSVVAQLRRQDGSRSQVLEVNLGHFDEQSRSTLAAYLRTLARRLAQQVGPSAAERNLEEEGATRGDPLERMTEFMEQLLRRAPDRLVLALDTADAIYSCPFSEDVLGMLRQWAELATTEPWSRLRLILAISSSATLFAGSRDPAAFSQTAPIWLRELRDQQVRQLAERHGLAWAPDECRAVLQLLGGHPYLLRLLMHAVICKQVALGDVLSQRWQSARIFDDYLQSLRRRLEQHPALIEALRSLDGPVQGPMGSLYDLYQAGILRHVDSGGFALRSPVYKRLLDLRPGA